MAAAEGEGERRQHREERAGWCSAPRGVFPGVAAECCRSRFAHRLGKSCSPSSRRNAHRLLQNAVAAATEGRCRARRRWCDDGKSSRRWESLRNVEAVLHPRWSRCTSGCCGGGQAVLSDEIDRLAKSLLSASGDLLSENPNAGRKTSTTSKGSKCK